MRNYKFKLYLNKHQETEMIKYQNVCRMLWNLCVAQRNDYWNKARLHGPESYKAVYAPISEYGQSAELTQLKKEFEFMYEVPSGTLTNILKNVDKSMKLFFSNLKKNPQLAGKPRFKRKQDSVGLLFKGGDVSGGMKIIRLDGMNYATIKLPKFGPIRFRYHKEFNGEIKNAMVKLETDGWYIIITADTQTSNVVNKVESAIGIDVGIKHTLSLSDGSFIDIPDYIKDMSQRVKVLQKRMRNKKRGSSNSRKAYNKIAKVHQKIARAKDYFLKLTASELTKKHTIIAIEKLNIRNMTKSAKGTKENPGTNVKVKSGLNREILFNNWGMFKELLKNLGEKNNCKIVEINPKFTSQRCSKCGMIHKGNRVSQEKFVCLSCLFEINADTNAAINLKHLALAGEESVEKSRKTRKRKDSMKQKCSTNEEKSGTYVT